MTLAEAVRKSTSLPASRLRLDDRGRIAKNMKADLVVFDPVRILDLSSFAEPEKLSQGVALVFVNGVLVWDGSGATGARPCRILRRWNWEAQP